ncbi:Aste57867_13864 [Aphanomyces stellatus]|uniref:Aste57867_13864 protein n=1 Tax=Aphanomyces stellatus TaxID=120398 RepID=A0A485KZI5_9STRA|nr:hypothetical protein As57867_013813 [Aphanomyces stellatus]VFT90695.1 Aste57867_13864 [Aphanomyces stellatus]
MEECRVLRSGVLYKKGKKVGLFGRDNWKPRYCVLTWNKLQYFTCEGGALKGEVDMSHLTRDSIAIMPADCKKTGRSASSIWRVAITTPQRRFLIAATTEFEMRDWVGDLLKITARHDTSTQVAAGDAVICRRHPHAPVRPMLLESMDVLAKSNRRNISLVPGQVHLRREARHAHSDPIIYNVDPTHDIDSDDFGDDLDSDDDFI